MSDVQNKQSPYPVIHALECKACGRCVLDCPKQVLELGKVLNERGYAFAVYKGEGCSGCGNCYYTCPEPNAVEVRVPKVPKKEITEA